MIILSWPPKELNPNTRCHWSKKAKAAKAYRKEAGWATKLSGDVVAADGVIDMHIMFYPPDKRSRDDDNLMAAFKSARDGIADRLGVNDKRFRAIMEVGAVIKGGQVRVILSS